MLYRTYAQHLKEKYNEKVYKLPVNLPITCPNRDGTCSYGGCIFCGEVGAAFENLPPEMSVSDQIDENMRFIGTKYKAKKFIAYFQNFTNTYMPFETFKNNILSAVKENIVEIAVSTRPDCIRDDYMEFLYDLSQKTGINISIELGLQTVNHKTLEKINRGHSLAEFIDAVMTIQKYGFEICTHLILNLPWDDISDTIECAKILSALRINQVKLHSLYIVKDTPMAKMYLNKEFDIGCYMDYVERVITFLEYLSPEIVIQRLIGRSKEEHSIFSNYATSWWKIKDTIDEVMNERGTYQGRLCTYLGGTCLGKFENLK